MPTRPGVAVVLGREAAAARFELPADRLGDIVVIGEQSKVLGTSPERHFIVHEQINLEISKTKLPYKIYLLEKQGVDTFSVLEQISKKNNVPLSDIGIRHKRQTCANSSTYDYSRNVCD